MYKIKEMPFNTRPRERMIDQGATALKTEELIAILLRTGTKECSVLNLAKSLLYHLEHFEDLKRLTIEELCLVKGIKKAKAATILAAIELGKRIHEYSREEKTRILKAKDIYEYLKTDLMDLEQEHFMCIYLNTKSEVIKKETVFIGTLNQTLIHPREIFKHAVRLNASAIILAHNHPTGDALPSKADFIVTEQIKKASELMGIDIIDHVIIGYNQYYSIKTAQLCHLK